LRPVAIPAKQPADEETDVQERAHDRRGREQTRACRSQELIQSDAGARSRQIDGPHVMKRHAGKKVVNPQWQPFELLCRNLGHPASLVVNEVQSLDRRIGIGLTEDRFQEVLGAGGASHPNNDWPHTRLSDQLKCQEGATLPFCRNHFCYKSNQLAIAGNAESIPIWEFLLLDHSRSELGKERCLTLA